MVSETVVEPMRRSTTDLREERVLRVLRSVMDPEIPVLSVLDLGVVRYVRSKEGRLCVGITPTYSGCPATEVIQRSVREALARAGMDDVMVETVLSPPWSSDWLSEEGRRKLKAFGICPPVSHGSAVTCPRCGSDDAQRLSEFGSTPCKAHYRCSDCLEPFDVFKCI
jgi:ring-1,2-phenylacetyl-CoA epoxidase subunit PaaD